MATALDIITRALQGLGVLALGREPKAAETEYCLSQLNEMIAGWRINGLDLAHTELATTDALDVPDDHIEAIRLSLAERVASTFGAQISPVNALVADQGRQAMRAYHFSIKTIGIDHPAAEQRSATDI